MRPVLPALLSLLVSPALHAQAPLTAAEIMARVAMNQDAADAERSHFVYVQHANVQSRKGKTVMCAETTDSRVTPGADGSTQTLLSLDGRLLVKGNYITYHELPSKRPPVPDEVKDDPSLPNDERERRRKERERTEDTDEFMDRDLVENLRKNLTNDKGKDGLHAGLFPLTSKAQGEYSYVLKGRERRNGRDVYHLTFTPKDNDEYGWKGDAWIDTEAFQPVMVQTAMAKKLPFTVRFLMGTSLPGLGFAATYAPQPSGTWFPVSFGTEFKINVLFFLHRTIALSVENREFQKTHVESRVVPEAPTP